MVEDWRFLAGLGVTSFGVCITAWELEAPQNDDRHSVNTVVDVVVVAESAVITQESDLQPQRPVLNGQHGASDDQAERASGDNISPSNVVVLAEDCEDWGQSIVPSSGGQQGIVRGRNENDNLPEQNSGGVYPISIAKQAIESPRAFSKKDDQEQSNVSTHQKGYCFAVLNVILDTYSAALVKKHCGSLNPLEINFLRFGVAALTLGILALASQGVEKRLGITHGKSKDKSCWRAFFSWYKIPSGDKTMSRSDWRLVTSAVFFVTFLGPVFATYALFQMPVGVLMALTSIGPLYSIPAVYVVKGEKVSLKAAGGAFGAVIGVCLLCWGVNDSVD